MLFDTVRSVFIVIPHHNHNTNAAAACNALFVRYRSCSSRISLNLSITAWPYWKEPTKAYSAGLLSIFYMARVTESLNY